MAVHVGINPEHGKVSYYYETGKHTVNININEVRYNEIDKVNLMFEEIKNRCNINEKFGCICIFLPPYYANEIRQQFINAGFRCGYKNIEIINLYTAIYLGAISQTKYKPKNFDIIWIQFHYCFYVWKINQTKAEFIGNCYGDPLYIDGIGGIVNETELKNGPDVVISNICRKENIFTSEVKFFNYSLDKSYKSEGALIKARLNAGDQDIAYFGTINFLLQKIVLQLNGQDIMSFEARRHLPIVYSQMLKRKTEFDELEIIFGSNQNESFKLQNLEEINLTFKLDTNEIYSVIFQDPKSPPQEEKKFATYVDSSTKSSTSLSNYIPSFFRNKSLPTENKKLTPPMSELSINNFYTFPAITTPINAGANIIGIDLGTSRCCAAVNRRNVLDNKGERLLPSYVAYNEKNPTCGQVAVNRLRQYSKSTIFDSKRIIGRKFNDIEIDSNWNFSVILEDGKIYMEVNGFNEKRKITAEEVAADLLKHVKQKSEDFQGTKLMNVVITVPATFTDFQKAETLKAAKLAGWKDIVLLPEPIAAAFAYFIDRSIPNNSNVLVFDLGGGTLDVCIFRIENNQIKIISNTGDSKLGGRDFDTVLINYFKNILLTKHGISTLKDKKYKLMLECQKIKEDLSSVMDMSLDINEFDTNKDGIISITREDFYRMTTALLNKIRNTIQSALFKSNLKGHQINKVLQVGGGSRMPFIKTLLLDIFPDAVHCCEEHPDEVVAMGAAYYAYSIFSK